MKRDRFDHNGNILPVGVSYLNGRPSPYVCRVLNPKTGEKLCRAFRTRLAAFGWLREIGLEELVPREETEPAHAKRKLPFEVAVEKWFEDWRASRSPSAMGSETRGRIVRGVLIAFFKEEDVTIISEDKIEAFVKWQREVVSYKNEPLSLKTIKNHLSVLKVFFDWLCRERVVCANPCIYSAKKLNEDGKVKRLKERRTRAVRNKCLNLEEAEALLKTAEGYGSEASEGCTKKWVKGEIYPCAMLLFCTGIRLGELCALRYKHLEFQNALGVPLACWQLRIEGKMTSERTIDGSFLIENFTKGGTDRKIPLNREIQDAIEAWLKTAQLLGYRGDPESPLFPVAQSYLGFKSMWRRLAKRAGLPKEKLGAHSIRHTTASMLRLQGQSIGAIQEVLGHAHATTTEVYLHSFGAVDDSVMSALPRFRKSPAPEKLREPSSLLSLDAESKSQESIPQQLGTNRSGSPRRDFEGSNVVQLFKAK